MENKYYLVLENPAKGNENTHKSLMGLCPCSDLDYCKSSLIADAIPNPISSVTVEINGSTEVITFANPIDVRTDAGKEQFNAEFDTTNIDGKDYSLNNATVNQLANKFDKDGNFSLIGQIKVVKINGTDTVVACGFISVCDYSSTALANDSAFKLNGTEMPVRFGVTTKQDFIDFLNEEGVHYSSVEYVEDASNGTATISISSSDNLEKLVSVDGAPLPYCGNCRQIFG